MTLARSIADAAASLPPRQQREVLDFVEFMRTREKTTSHSAARRHRRPKAPASLHPALQKVYGIWADRTDLPQNPVEAVRALRLRSAERRKNA